LLKSLFLLFFFLGFWFFVVRRRPEYISVLNPRRWAGEARKIDRKIFLHLAIVLVALVVVRFVVIPLANIGALELSGGVIADQSENVHVQVFELSPWLLLAAVTLVPIIEEWLFRFVMIEESRRYGKVALGVLLSSALFGLVHWTNPGYTIYVAIVPFCSGLVYAMVYLVGGLKCSILVHSGSNFITWLIWMA